MNLKVSEISDRALICVIIQVFSRRNYK